MGERLRFIFFGTPDFAVAVLQEMEDQGRIPVAVVCQPDRPRGRGRKTIPPPAKLWAQQRTIPVLQPSRQKDPEYIESLSLISAELSVVAAYGQILPKTLLRIVPMGFVNIHPSLVPRYRGAAPIQWTLINGDKQTGVSILKVTPKLDDGEVLALQKVEVDGKETAPELGKRLASIGGKLCSDIIFKYEKNQAPVAGTPQDPTCVTWAPELNKSDGNIDWRQNATKLHNLIRGVQPWPGAKTMLRQKPLKIYRAVVSTQAPHPEAVAGQVIQARGGSVRVQTGDGVIELLEVQAAGKKKLSVQAFLSGRQIAEGDILG